MDHFAQCKRRILLRPTINAALCALLLSGCRAIGPSNDRDWSPDQAVLPHAEFEGNSVTVHNIRNCAYRNATEYDVHYYDKTFEIDKLKSVDFVMVPFSDFPGGAHTFLSFGFEGDEYVAISVEIRREKGEEYSALNGLTNQYELMYVVGDERDLIQLRSNYRLDDVYLYRATASAQSAQTLFRDMLTRANALRDKPEYYHLVTNNCTTNIMRHINSITPGRIPYSYEVLLPGYSDALAYRLGLIDTSRSFAQTKEAARINRVAYINRESPDFSSAIRR